MTTGLVAPIRDGLFTILTPLEAVIVSDGIPVSLDFGNYLMIGVSDPDDKGIQDSAAESQSWHGTGAGGGTSQSRNNLGAIWATALTWTGQTGNVGTKAARDGVRATLTVLENQLRADPTLGGITGLLWIEFAGEQNWREVQSSSGSRCHCSFTLPFTGLI